MTALHYRILYCGLCLQMVGLLACQTVPRSMPAGPHTQAGSQCVQGDCKQGRGVVRWSDRAELAGEFQAGILQGPAVFTFEGQDYRGIYERGFIREGSGPLVYSDGNWYLGEFRDGLRHGQGTVYAAGGRILYRGQWRQGQRRQTVFYLHDRAVPTSLTRPDRLPGMEDEDGADDEDGVDIGSAGAQCFDSSVDSCGDACVEALIEALVRVALQALCDAITR